MNAFLFTGILQKALLRTGNQRHFSRLSPHSPMSSMKRPILLVLDFDGTITTADTTALIGSACIAKARSLAAESSAAADFNPKHPTPDSDPGLQSMAAYTQAYISDYKRWQASSSSSSTTATKSPESSPRSIADEVAHLSRLRDVESASFCRVRRALLRSSGAMKGFVGSGNGRAWIRAEGRRMVRDREVGIRDVEGLRGLVRRVQREGGAWAVVSVSWSKGFVLGVLEEVGLLDLGRGKGEMADGEGRTWCNELMAEAGVEDVDGVGMEATASRDLICVAADKEAAFRDAVRSMRAKIATGIGDKPFSIYVGDSTTDLACLAAADVGICMRNAHVASGEDKLATTLARLRVECVEIPKAGGLQQMDPGRMYWTTNFRDIDDYIATSRA